MEFFLCFLGWPKNFNAGPPKRSAMPRGRRSCSVAGYIQVTTDEDMGMGQNPIPPVVHIKIAGKWMFIPLKMICIGIDP